MAGQPSTVGDESNGEEDADEDEGGINVSCIRKPDKNNKNNKSG
jgi:hypothetical protein